MRLLAALIPIAAIAAAWAMRGWADRRACRWANQTHQGLPTEAS